MICSSRHARNLAKQKYRRSQAIESLEQRIVLDSTIVFNEIMYNPAPLDEVGEWVELHNQMSVDMDISNWSLEGGVDYQFPEGTTVPQQGYLVIAANPDSVRQAHGLDNVMGPLAGRLDNGGEELRLVNNSDRLMNAVTYSDRGDWPNAPDGSGASLAKYDERTASDISSNWRFSAEQGGTPGSRNFIVDPLFVSEAILPANSTARAYVPLDGTLEDDWIAPEFDDGSWTTGTTAVGFDSRTDYDDLIGLDLDEPPNGQPPIPLADTNTSVYVRIPFELESDINEFVGLTLDMRYEDGFVAYLNGVEVAHSNAPGRDGNDGPLTWFSSAARSRSDRRAVDVETFDLTGFRDVFRPGENMLAFHGLNRELRGSSGDFLLLPELVGTRELSPDELIPIQFNEVAAADGDSFFVELANDGDRPVDLGGFVISTSQDGLPDYTLPAQIVRPGDLISVSSDQLGFWPNAGERVFLYSPGKTEVVDGRRVTGRLRGRSDQIADRWIFPGEATPGSPNSFELTDDIVINEIMYLGPTTSEIHGRDATYFSTTLLPIDATWRYSKDFNFGGGDLPYDPGPDWQEQPHAVDGLNWFEGNGPLGYSTRRPEVRLQQELARPDIVPNKITTYYFETEFGISEDQLASIDDIAFDHLIDDGAVFYINGHEVHRYNLPEGPIDVDTVASGDVQSRVQLVESGTISKDQLVALPALNRFSVEVHQSDPASPDIVFGLELFGRSLVAPAVPSQPASESSEEWLELLNRNDTEAIDLSGWRFSDGIQFEFAEGTVLEPGEYLVLAKNPQALLAARPNLDTTKVVGPYSGLLANGGELLELRDSFNNPADQVHYHDRGRWNEYANGDHASLELIDPRSDNSIAESWTASDQSDQVDWNLVRYVGPGINVGNDPRQWQEFLFGLLEKGEFLIDDIRVIENPGTGEARQLIQNGTFESDVVGESADKWRIIGNHHGTVVDDPDDPSNQVLHVLATDPTEHMHNNAGTTLKAGDQFVDIDEDAEYEISFRAKWLSGSNQLHSRLYFNRLARKTLLDVPERIGTPGAANSAFAENVGPTYTDMAHFPVIPNVGEPVMVSIAASDPDGVAHMTLWYSVDGAPFQSTTMNRTDGIHVGEIPGQEAATVVQFYVEGTDGQGAATMFPADGPDSRALYTVQDGRAELGDVHNVRIVMTEADAQFMRLNTNVMSNDRLGATVIVNEQQVFYDAGIRLKGSERGRNQQVRVGYNIRFDPENLFRGVHNTIGVDRSGAGNEFHQKEILIKHAIGHAGQIPGMYDDLIHVISPSRTAGRDTTGSAMLIMAGFGDEFLDTYYEGGSQSSAYEQELIYYATTTVDGNDVESLKLPQPDSVVGVAVAPIPDFENDVEAYRWHYLHENQRNRDEYLELIDAIAAIGLRSGDEFHEATGKLVDVDQWLRSFAVQSLFGIGDNYATGAQHNAIFFLRPSDGKLVYFPFDMDFTFSQSATSPMVTGNGELRKFVSDPNNMHAYHGHIHDIISTTFNSQYMNPWIDHYDAKMSPSLQSFKNYISTRVDSLTQDCGQPNNCLAPQVDFQITTSGPIDLDDEPIVSLTGTGWINVRQIRLAGSDVPLDINWSEVTTWETDIPVSSAIQELTLEAYDFQDILIGTSSVSVNSDFQNPVADSFRVSELHYNPAEPTADELAALPRVNNDDFEFFEVTNVGSQTINLAGVSVTDGIDFRFPSVLLEPGQFGVVVKDRDAFQLRYGTDIPVIGSYEGNLRNAGEQIRIQELSGNIVQDFVFDDWYLDTDGLGRSLVAADGRAEYNDVGNWRPSIQLGGSPAAGESTIPLGDANFDQQFDQVDIALALQSGKYLASESATWSQGDWNGDGLFDQRDIVAALRTGRFAATAQLATTDPTTIDEVMRQQR